MVLADGDVGVGKDPSTDDTSSRNGAATTPTPLNNNDNMNVQNTAQTPDTSNDNDSFSLLNWQGRLPICLTLSPTCVSSPTYPAPVHALVARHNYLHTALTDAVRRLHAFAPTMMIHQRNNHSNNHDSTRTIQRRSEPGVGESVHDSKEAEQQSTNNNTISDSDGGGEGNNSNSDHNNNTNDCPVCWFEDEVTHLPLPWHVPLGVLYDLHHNASSTSSNSSAVSTEQNDATGAGNTITTTSDYQQHQHRRHHHPPLPWKIRLYFGYSSHNTTEANSGGSSMLLPLEAPVRTQVRFVYKHSLKQALSLLYHHNKNNSSSSSAGSQTNSNAKKSKPALNLSRHTHQRLWEAVQRGHGGLFHQALLAADMEWPPPFPGGYLPVRILLAHSHRTLQTPCPYDPNLTLDGLLLLRYQEQQQQLHSSFTIMEKESEQDTEPPWETWISGIQPPGTARVVDLWRALAQADLFLYICVRRRRPQHS